tara:strand:+ start:176048 stop:177193 length:1146 start_codon:yes stop_codon:yes gene_type:complete
MKLFIIPSWYPTEIHPESGSFFRDRAYILYRSEMEVIIGAPVTHSLKDLFRYSPTNSIQEDFNNGLPTYLHESINIFPKMEKLFFKRYKKFAINIFNKLLESHGLPDLVMIHSSLWAGGALGEMLNKKNIPFILTEHLKEFLIPNEFSIFQKKIIHNTYSMASQILLSSSPLKNAISKNFNTFKPKLNLLPNPVDEHLFTLRKVPESKSQLTIICISLFRPEKRIDLILESFKNLIHSGIKAKLKLIGGGPLKHEIENQIKRLKISDRVELKGYLSQNQIVKELHNSDLLVLASNIETFGTVLIEAQACGLPVVATDCGGPRDIVTPESGILVKPGSVFELTKAIKTLIRSFDRFNPSDIRNSVIKRFGKQKYVESIKNII